MSKTAKNSPKTVYVCQNCGKESLRWEGRCPDCKEGNSFVEKAGTTSSVSARRITLGEPPLELATISTKKTERLKLPINEFNRVLGGGVVPGSLVLISGDPGIGKSTLLLQVAASLPGESSVIYISGEETAHQLKLRARRLGISGEGLYILTETDIEAVLGYLEQSRPAMVVVDSIQTVSLPELGALPGSINQIRECTLRLMQWAKKTHTPVLISGHVTKEGNIAGPRLLEHMVDVVLYLEGEAFSAYRLLRSIKNRFGSTNEVGVFEMKSEGMVEVANPSETFLSQRQNEAIGSSVVPTIEGSRPLLVEIQALTNPTSFGLPRRTANGIDFNRLLLITAVLTRRVGLKLGNQDILVNVAGGLKINEPAADLGIALAIASSHRDRSITPRLAAIGEVGLSGELRAVAQIERRIKEAARMGFTRCIVPKTSTHNLKSEGVELIFASTLKEAINIGLKAETGNG